MATQIIQEVTIVRDFFESFIKKFINDDNILTLDSFLSSEDFNPTDRNLLYKGIKMGFPEVYQRQAETNSAFPKSIRKPHPVTNDYRDTEFIFKDISYKVSTQVSAPDLVPFFRAFNLKVAEMTEGPKYFVKVSYNVNNKPVFSMFEGGTDEEIRNAIPQDVIDRAKNTNDSIEEVEEDIETIMNEKYIDAMTSLGYEFVAYLSSDWETINNEVLEKNEVITGSTTVHFYIRDSHKPLLQECYSSYYSQLNTDHTEKNITGVQHFFLKEDVYKLLADFSRLQISTPYQCFKDNIVKVLEYISTEEEILNDSSSFYISNTRPYYNKFDKNNGAIFKAFRPLLTPSSQYRLGLFKKADEQGQIEYAIMWEWNTDTVAMDREIASRAISRIGNEPLQQIFYGAPGTGKSDTTKRITMNEDFIRTTFHPDSDYASFVGAYKPVSTDVDLRNANGDVVMGDNGNPIKEKRVIYDFIEQAFLEAYIAAWQKWAIQSGSNEKPKKQFLIIEEINRGNCAQIFGDLFQLLDRNENGFSVYPIKADSDLQRHLATVFADLTIANAHDINTANYEGKPIIESVKSGELLVLPNNFYIWATMNTSDQSLFPMDSAFKRRWDWDYIPISEGRDKASRETFKWKISVDNDKYDWWKFLQAINDQIDSITSSEDKKLGYFFCKATNGVISQETFVSKVIFYLWNDVFKDFGFESSIFNDTQNEKLSFSKFYKINTDGKKEVVPAKIKVFMSNLSVDVDGREMETEEALSQDEVPDQPQDEAGTIPQEGQDGNPEA